MIKKTAFWGTFLILILMPFTFTAIAYDQIIAFGDSTSDNGPDDGFGIIEFTNGDVWLEYLANNMSCPLLDYAYSGGTTGYDNPWANIPIWGLNWQVDQFVDNTPAFSEETLFSVYAGGNDYLFGPRLHSTATQNIITALDKLANLGAQNILVSNLIDLGATPKFDGDIATTDWVNQFNTSLENSLNSFVLSHPEVNIYLQDNYTYLNQLIATNDATGIFDNVTDMKYEIDYNGNILSELSPDDYMWFDGIHPTTHAHQLVAEDVFNTLQEGSYNPVPIPATVWLFASGLIGLIGIRRRFNK